MGCLAKYEVSVVDFAVENGNCVLHVAAEEGRNGEAAAALAYNANIIAKNSFGQIPAYLAAKRGHDRVVEQLAAADPDGAEDHWILHCAVLQRDVQVVDYVGRRRRSVMDARHPEAHRTALWLAAWWGAADVALSLLTRYHTRPNTTCDCNTTPLFIASQRGDVEMVKLLSRYRAEVDIKDDVGIAPR